MVILPKPSETQNLHWKNEATCWNWPFRSFHDSAIRVPLTCDYKKDSQWTAAGRQPSKPPPSVHLSTSIVKKLLGKFPINCVLINIPFPSSGSNIFYIKNFPKIILWNCLHYLVAGTKSRWLSVLLFSFCDYTLQIIHTGQFFLNIWIGVHIWVKGVLLHL